MLEDQDSDFILSIFLMEAWDTVATVEEGARRLGGGKPPSSGMIDPLVVVTHRLKGAAALHGYPVVSAVALVMENLLEQLPALPAPERGRKVEVLGNVVVAVKRMLEMIGDDGREDVNTVAGLRARYPELFPAPTAPEPPPDPVRQLERTPAAPTANAAAVPSPAEEPVVAVEAKPKPTAAPPSATRRVPEAPTVPIDEIIADRLLRELERFFAEHAESVPYFAPEAAEHLDVMSRSLLALEQSTGSEREEEVATLFRAVHTLKGAAYTVGCAPVGDVAHRIEDILDGVRDRRLELRPAVIEAIFGGLDTLRLLLDRTVRASPDARAAVQRTLDVLDGLRPAPGPLEIAVPCGQDGAAAEPVLVPAAPAAIRPRFVPPAPEPRRKIGREAKEARPSIRVHLDRLDYLLNTVGELCH